ncbi:mannose-6-phosphate isomerase, class I [Parafrigoribacterium mesophilum]|uniref:mannose-6-phosphate isomerase, class I n=1 Tax=Parafrigoribacterium mesophilum TaxID=433646 RepID=UPI0031FE17AF
MFVGITNTPRPYAWGSTTAIAEILGVAASGGPEAELWLGAHPGSPSRVLDAAQTGGAADLGRWIATDPTAALGAAYDGPQLPFLLKVLAAEHPLSLQAHPSAAQARAGYLRETDAGVPLDAPHRNYRDAHPKPEMIYALSDRFDALCGFRPVDEVRDVLQGFVDLDVRGDTPQAALLYDLMDRLDTLPEAFEWLLAGGPQVDALVARVSRIAMLAGYAGRDAFPEFVGAAPLPGSFGIDRELATVRLLTAEYPGDPGIVVSLLLNQVSLARGEALYLPAGNIHAYLHGVGIELMSASDNVLRGGLTPKHVDVPELLSVLDFTDAAVPLLEPAAPSAGVSVFRPGSRADAPDFTLVHVAAPGEPGVSGAGNSSFALPGPAIALCTAGAMCVAGAAASVDLERGQAVYITPDEATLTFTGTGELFLATTR